MAKQLLLVVKDSYVQRPYSNPTCLEIKQPASMKLFINPSRSVGVILTFEKTSTTILYFPEVQRCFQDFLKDWARRLQHLQRQTRKLKFLLIQKENTLRGLEVPFYRRCQYSNPCGSPKQSIKKQAVKLFIESVCE